ncbi:uncharacterized protein LOC108597097 [Drosophila busckii]|uniref:uncharacterized protein LOC108597097 n=1 Tax=Drosophila busckii TaxID=30019 RepID=UPI0014328D3F|nr:uncharacterized protein LOC108597097 [Drosophila busckii]
MVALWQATLLWLLLLLLPLRQASYILELRKVLLQQLNGSSAEFEAWSGRLSEQLSLEQQQRLAWNVNFLQTPQSVQQLQQLQQQLSPSASAHNTLRLLLWLRFYWQLQRSSAQQQQQLKVLLPQFALTLRAQLEQRSPKLRAQLQNMLQSLPHTLATLASSRYLCLQHARELLYAEPAGVLQLGANSNCSMWQLHATATHWLRLQNVCVLPATWYVNMQLSNMLLTAPSNNASKYCVQDAQAYFEQQQQLKSDDCNWRFTDCTHLQRILNLV